VTVPALRTTEAQASPVKVSGHSAGKGHTPDTLPTASASITNA